MMRNLFEYRRKGQVFFDGWETSQDWTVLWWAQVERVTTDPFQGSYCVKLYDPTDTGPAGLSRDNLWPAGPWAEVEVALKTQSAGPGENPCNEVYFYNKDHTRIALIFGQDSSGLLLRQGGDGTKILYQGSLDTWYRFRVRIKWTTEKLDIWLYDRQGNLLAYEGEAPFLNSPVIETIAHILLYSAIACKGTLYWDAVEVDP